MKPGKSPLSIISVSKRRVASYPATAEIVFRYPTPEGQQSQTWHVHYNEVARCYLTRTGMLIPVFLLEGLK